MYYHYDVIIIVKPRGSKNHNTIQATRQSVSHFPRPYTVSSAHLDFWTTVCKTVRLCYRTVVCLSCLSVTLVTVLWPNGWMDQDGTRYGGRPRPARDCVRWGPSSPPVKGHSSQFSANVLCGQTAEWMKTPLGTEVDLDTGHIVLDGVPALRERGTTAPPALFFGPCFLWPRSPISGTAELLYKRPHTRQIPNRCSYLNPWFHVKIK